MIPANTQIWVAAGVTAVRRRLRKRINKAEEFKRSCDLDGGQFVFVAIARRSGSSSFCSAGDLQLRL
jgi:hypothetical protein